MKRMIDAAAEGIYPKWNAGLIFIVIGSS